MKEGVREGRPEERQIEAGIGLSRDEAVGDEGEPELQLDIRPFVKNQGASQVDRHNHPQQGDYAGRQVDGRFAPVSVLILLSFRRVGHGFVLILAVIFGLQTVDRSFSPILPLLVVQLGVPPERVATLAGVVS